MKHTMPIRWRLYSAALAVALAAGACREPLEFDGEVANPYAVAQCVAQADSVLSVRLTWSRFFLSSNRTAYPPIANANLSVTCNGAPLTLDSADGATYRFAHTVRPGDTLRMRATVPGYERGELSAEAVVPARPAVTLENLSVTTQQSDYGDNEVTHAIALRLDDPPGDNYYMLRLEAHILYKRYQGYADEDGRYHDTVVYDTIWETPYFECDDPALVSPESGLDIAVEGVGGNVYDRLLFTDAAFPGQSHTLTLRHDAYYYDDNGRPLAFRVIVASCSPELYRYMQSADAAYNNEDNPFAEPSQVICNVQNGIGCFGAQASAILQFMAQQK